MILPSICANTPLHRRKKRERVGFLKNSIKNEMWRAGWHREKYGDESNKTSNIQGWLKKRKKKKKLIL